MSVTWHNVYLPDRRCLLHCRRVFSAGRGGGRGLRHGLRSLLHLQGGVRGRVQGQQHLLLRLDQLRHLTLLLQGDTLVFDDIVEIYTFQMCRSSPDICQLRLSFETFSVSAPSSSVSGDSLATPRTQCLTAQFSAHSGAGPLPLLCGTNTGQHMILGRRAVMVTQDVTGNIADMETECSTLTFTWTSAAAAGSWNILLQKIPCQATWRPPPGCLQVRPWCRLVFVSRVCCLP